MVSAEDVLAVFDLEDVEFAEAIQHLPVADISTISTDMISGSAFEFFVSYMQLITAYELKIQEQIITIYNLIYKLKNNNTHNNTTTSTHDNNTTHSTSNHNNNLNNNNINHNNNTITINNKLANTIKYRILAHNHYKLELKRKRRAFRDGRVAKWKMDELDISKIWQMVNTENVVGFEFLTLKFGKPLSDRDIEIILAGLQVEINKSKDRVGRNRRSEFRKALTMNYKTIFQNFLDKAEDMYQLHDTKIDRMVIDIYSPELMTYDPVLKSHLDKKQKQLKRDHDIKEIPTLDFIEAVKSVYKYDFKDIDGLVEEFENERKQKLQLGFERKGLIISQYDFGKAIFTYNPESSGAPIRLRIITNVQNNVRQELTEDNPEKAAVYRQRTWAIGSEVNFILPEDYDYYVRREATFCYWLEHICKDLFIDHVNKYLNVAVDKKSLVAYISQVEVCYEEEFAPRRPAAKLYRKLCKSPNLFEFIQTRQLYYHRYSNAYCNVKYDGITDRPSLHMDIFSINPDFPIMQYKVYPKFYNEKKNIMIRTELTPTRFIKHLALDDDDLPISQKVLSNPEYVREIIERLFQFELKLNGVRGQGYNKRFKECKTPGHETLATNLIGKAIFGRNADEYQIELEKIKGGRIANTVPIYYRKKMVRMGIATKIKRGTYTTTGSFNEIVKKLYQVR